jgi:Spy/CpxP family protein refolding chaperone
MTLARAILLTLVLSLAAAALGVWGGAAYVQSRIRQPPSLHEVVHERLNLTSEQRRRIEAMERDYDIRRSALEAEMRAANADLAQAYQESHAFTPKAQAAIDRFHRAMDALQKETMVHVLAMRSALTAEQAARFDDTVVRALTASGS